MDESSVEEFIRAKYSEMHHPRERSLNLGDAIEEFVFDYEENKVILHVSKYIGQFIGRRKFHARELELWIQGKFGSEWEFVVKHSQNYDQSTG